MADTLSAIVDPGTVFGNMRATCYRMTCGASQTSAQKFGLDTVQMAMISVATTTAGGSVMEWQLSAGAITVSANTGDILNVLAFGQ
jgi:hypothetical protein